MQARSFSVGEILKAAWKKFKEQPWTWVASLLLMSILFGTQPFVIDLLTGTDEARQEQVIERNQERERSNPNADENTERLAPSSPLAYFISLIYSLIHAGLSLGLTYMAIRAADGLSIHISDLFARFQYLFYNFIAQFLYALIVFVGLLLLIVPGVIWGIRYALYPYFIADKKVGPIQALKMSAEATQGAKWDLFTFMIAAVLIGFAGLLAFGFGLLVAIPVITIGMALIYRRLTNQEGLVSDEIPVVHPSSISQP